ncbi:MAG: DUF2933 domain-containing protein [Rhodoferax sp.]|jgi:flagellar basal body-associated protein FliL|nr:DUF2933 domain-containing protein [Rhodoferax sp.]
MNCSKTMIKVAAGLGVVATVLYFAFPQAQSLILANAPLLLVLACPISMGVMMWMMRGSNDTKQREPADSGTARIPVYVLDNAPGKV